MRFRPLVLPVVAAITAWSMLGCDDEETTPTGTTAATTATTGGAGGDGGSGATGGGGSPTTGGAGGQGGGSGGGGSGGAAPLPVEIAFAVRAGDEPFSCGTSYTGLGVEPSDVTPVDLRFYVHDVRLVSAEDGTEVPVALDQDGAWQVEDVAMLDFEDATGACSNGTAVTNTSVRGIAPGGTYDGIKFRVGVPFELNHEDVTTSPSPLNVETLFWGWGFGHIFFSVVTSASDAGGPGNDHFVHLGSVGCMGDPALGEVVSCSTPNRPEVTLESFDPASSLVVIDVETLLAGSNLLTEIGCHSFPDTDACLLPFDALGIDYETGTMTPETQTTFRVEAR